MIPIGGKSLSLIERVNTSREEVRKTGKAFLIAGCVLGLIVFLSHSHVVGWWGWNWMEGVENTGWRWLLGIGIGLFVLSRVAYPIMKPVHVAWMKLALVLGWISTRIVLGLFFYLVLTPVGLLMRLVGKDMLNERIDRSAQSYWVKREPKPFDPASYERLF